MKATGSSRLIKKAGYNTINPSSAHNFSASGGSGSNSTLKKSLQASVSIPIIDKQSISSAPPSAPSDNINNSSNNNNEWISNELLVNEMLQSFLNACSEENLSQMNLSIQNLRAHILKYGLPIHTTSKPNTTNTNNNNSTNTTPSSPIPSTSITGTAVVSSSINNNGSNDGYDLQLRGRVWKLMLCLGSVSSSKYIALVQKNRSNKYGKIRSDSFRTFPNDVYFQSRVSEQCIIRVLNSFVHLHEPNFTYCQGMNTIAAPFLYSMSECEAFEAFSLFITTKIPLYYLSSHIGVEAGCKLVGRVLKEVDPELSDHFNKCGLLDYIYAFHCVSSLSASVPPFIELIKLWDFLIAFGPHFNILCVAAQILSLRDKLLATDNPQEYMDQRKWPSLNARFIIGISMSLISRLSPELYQNIVKHAHDPDTAAAITGRRLHTEDELYFARKKNLNVPGTPANTTAKDGANTITAESN